MANKLKTNKSIAKRVKVTKNNKFIHAKAWGNHLLTNKDKANRVAKLWKELAVQETEKIRALIPYNLR